MEDIKQALIEKGFTQWRYDVGSIRGQLSNSWRNYDLDINIILYGCTYDVRSLSTGELLTEKADQFYLLTNIRKGNFHNAD